MKAGFVVPTSYLWGTNRRIEQVALWEEFGVRYHPAHVGRPPTARTSRLRQPRAAGQPAQRGRDRRLTRRALAGASSRAVAEARGQRSGRGSLPTASSA